VIVISQAQVASIASRLSDRLRKERLDDFFQVSALASRARDFPCFVFLDSQHLAKFVIAFAADVFVKRHGLLQVVVVVLEKFFPNAGPCFSLFAKVSPLFDLRSL
jgi:hypothetical protein